MDSAHLTSKVSCPCSGSGSVRIFSRLNVPRKSIAEYPHSERYHCERHESYEHKANYRVFLFTDVERKIPKYTALSDKQETKQPSGDPLDKSRGGRSSPKENVHGAPIPNSVREDNIPL